VARSGSGTFDLTGSEFHPDNHKFRDHEEGGWNPSKQANSLATVVDAGEVSELNAQIHQYKFRDIAAINRNYDWHRANRGEGWQQVIPAVAEEGPYPEQKRASAIFRDLKKEAKDKRWNASTRAVRKDPLEKADDAKYSETDAFLEGNECLMEQVVDFTARLRSSNAQPGSWNISTHAAKPPNADDTSEEGAPQSPRRQNNRAEPKESRGWDQSLRERGAERRRTQAPRMTYSKPAPLFQSNYNTDTAPSSMHPSEHQSRLRYEDDHVNPATYTRVRQSFDRRTNREDFERRARQRDMVAVARQHAARQEQNEKQRDGKSRGRRPQSHAEAQARRGSAPQRRVDDGNWDDDDENWDDDDVVGQEHVDEHGRTYTVQKSRDVARAQRQQQLESGPSVADYSPVGPNERARRYEYRKLDPEKAITDKVWVAAKVKKDGPSPVRAYVPKGSVEARFAKFAKAAYSNEQARERERERRTAARRNSRLRESQTRLAERDARLDFRRREVQALDARSQVQAEATASREERLAYRLDEAKSGAVSPKRGSQH